MNTLANQNDTVNKFIIQVTLIDPLTDIVNKLKANDFRDCDIKWLNDKLDGFMKIAAESFGFKNHSFAERCMPVIMNKYAKEVYLRYFPQLLDYFKSFND